MSILQYPIMVVSYSDESIAAMVATLNNSDVASVVCRSFCEAEELALQGLYGGLLVDLPTIVKSKGEEKIVAYTLANFFPTLRVRAMGSMLVPMSMPGVAKQDKNLIDFINVTCRNFAPRKLRAYRRHPACLPAIVSYSGAEYRSFTLNLAWGGAFIVDVASEKYSNDTDISVILPEFETSVDACIRWIKPWGERSAPGIGISFKHLDEPLEALLASLLKSNKGFDRDRLLA